MSRELQKTIVFVIVAAGLCGAAFVKIPDRTGLDSVFDDQGKPFFPDFKDPTVAASLEVIDYDASTATIAPFKVLFKNGKWTIPSHNDYPADGKQRLVSTSTGVIGLNKDTIRSDRVEDHEAFGVVDPSDLKATTLKGQGKRVTIRDASDRVLADLIIGKEVKDRPDQRYVRIPSQKRTYGVKVNADLSAKFADWIETNLLKLDSSRIRKIVFDNHKVDPDAGRILPGENLTLERKDSTSPWTLQGAPIPPGKELDTDKIFSLVNALSDLKIVGVRPKPAGLSRDLKASEEGDIKLTRSGASSLANKGFYVVPDREKKLVKLYSNQGEVTVSTDEGANYSLRFGEVVFSSGEALSAGVGESDEKPATKDASKKDEAKSASTQGAESRYVMVAVDFNPALVPPKPTDPMELPAFPTDVFKRSPGTPEYAAQQKELADRDAAKKAERDKELEEPRKKVTELSDRFAPWYYVTPGESFRSIALDKTALIKDKSAVPAPGSPPGGPTGLPGNFNPASFGLPGGHP